MSAGRASAGPLVISVTDLEKTYVTRGRARVQALAGISLDVATGEFVTIVGQSGLREDDALKILAGLLPFTGGRVSLRGVPIEGPSRDIGIVFQDPVLLPWRTVLNNVLLPAQVLRPRSGRGPRPCPRAPRSWSA